MVDPFKVAGRSHLHPMRTSHRLQPMNIAETWGRRIRERREALDMSQTDLAALIGVNQSTLSRWESGDYAPLHHHVHPIAKALGVDPAAIFTYEETP
ncbi:MAG: helix-turn-helix domain-containing protein [Actinobacteria bacterium]|nr:helix-turn-helix domain-containing protein [Actinomycetota bacterium]